MKLTSTLPGFPQCVSPVSSGRPTPSAVSFAAPLTLVSSGDCPQPLLLLHAVCCAATLCSAALSFLRGCMPCVTLPPFAPLLSCLHCRLTVSLPRSSSCHRHSEAVCGVSPPIPLWCLCILGLLFLSSCPSGL